MAGMLDILWLERILNAQYPLIIQRWVFPLVIGLVSLSLPLLVSNIQRVDNKFKRYHVGSLLLTNCWVISYFVLMVLTLVSIVIYLLQLPRGIDLGEDLNIIIDHSAELCVLFTSTLLLFSVLIVIFVIIRHTTNTRSIYHNNKNRINKYFNSVICLLKCGKHTIEKDGEKAKSKEFYPMIAIIETAIEEHDLDFIDEILRDLNNYIGSYRNEYSKMYPTKRHNLVIYPSALTTELVEIARIGFEKRDALTQRQVFYFVSNTLFDIPGINNFDIPKNGLSVYSLKTLWTIIIEATNTDKREYIKLYWFAIFEYTKRMFQAPAVTSAQDQLPNNVRSYELTEEDKFERALIVYIQFMWQAYLYDMKKYDILKDVLEYYNGVADVEELRFLSLDVALQTYSAKAVTSNASARNFNLENIDNIIYNFSYYSIPSTSDIEKQKLIIANYMSFLVLYNYNIWEEVPICSRNVVNLSDRSVIYLDRTLRQKPNKPQIDINNISIKKDISEPEIDAFMAYLRHRSDMEEHTFLRDTKFKKQNKAILAYRTQSDLSFDLTHRNYLWIDDAQQINEADYRQADTDIIVNYSFPREMMIYPSIQHNYTLSKDIAQQFLGTIDQQVLLSYYIRHARRKIETKQAEELRQILLNTNITDRVILFAQDEEQISRYQQLLLGIFEPQRRFIDLTEGNRNCCIRCVIIPSGHPNLLNLGNQLWILPKDLQPIVRYKDLANKEGWTSIHDSTKTTKVILDKSDVKFSKIPIYVKFMDDIPDERGVPMAQINIKSEVEILGAKRLHIKVFRLN